MITGSKGVVAPPVPVEAAVVPTPAPLVTDEAGVLPPALVVASVTSPLSGVVEPPAPGPLPAGVVTPPPGFDVVEGVGAGVGGDDGCVVGTAEVGWDVGLRVGLRVGSAVGLRVGLRVGFGVGLRDGCRVGAGVGGSGVHMPPIGVHPRRASERPCPSTVAKHEIEAMTRAIGMRIVRGGDPPRVGNDTVRVVHIMLHRGGDRRASPHR